MVGNVASTRQDQCFAAQFESRNETSDISKCTEVTVLLRFQKKVAIASCVCRTMLIRRALESPDPGASNGGSNFVFGPFGADLVHYKVAGSPRIPDSGNSNWS